MNEPQQSTQADLLTVGLSDASSTNASRWQPPEPHALTGLPNLEPLSLIGCGGMGAVYRARQTHLDRLVALKVMPPERSRDAAFVERFTREARALARLKHPNIVTIYDFGRVGEWLYLEMELIEGATLREIMHTGRLSTVEVLRLIPHLCEALAHAHAAGVVHRDLKPENILIDGQGRAVITDFGLAKLRDEVPTDGASLTGSGAILGSAHYMAPEQIDGAATVDHRADLYALGVITYELLTGSLPLGRFQPPSQASGLDGRVDEVVMKSLERKPEDRWQSATELRQAFDGFQIKPAFRTTPTEPSSSTGQVAGALPRRSCVWKIAMFFAASLTVLIALMLIIFFASSSRDDSHHDQRVWPEPIVHQTSCQRGIDGSLVIRGGDSATTIPLGEIRAEGLRSRRYHLRTQARWTDVEGRAYLEMWSRFPDGASCFSRTLGEVGPMMSLTGTCTEWHEVWLPFDATEAKTAPNMLTVNLVLPGKGRVELKPLELIDAWPFGW